MESAARLLKNNKISRELMSEEDIACALWVKAVGKLVAAHTSRMKLVRRTLVVEVEDATWQKQLYPLTGQILGRLHTLMGSAAVGDLEFRIGVPRRQPQRAETHDRGAADTGEQSDDEAERILDPVLKKVYRLSRRKATG